MKRILTVVTVFVIALSMLSQAGMYISLVKTQTEEWSEPRQLTTNPAEDSYGRIMVDSSGNIWLVWWRRDGNLWHRISSDGGTSWSTEEMLVSDAGGTCNGIGLLQDSSGRIWVTWSDGQGVYYVISENDGLSWSARRQLSGGVLMPTLVEVCGDVWIIFHTNTLSVDDIWYRKTNDGGDTWSDPIQLTSHSAREFSSSAMVDSTSKLWFAGEREVGYGLSKYDLYYKISINHGASWSSDRQLTDLPRAESYPSIIEDVSGKIFVFFANAYAPECSDIYYRKTADGGNTWSDYQQLTANTYIDTLPCAALINNEIWVTWRSDRSGNLDLWFTKHVCARPIFDPKKDGFSFNNTIPKETISFEDAYNEISSAPWSSSVPQQYWTVLASLSVAVHNLQEGNCFGMSYTAKYYYENPSLFVSKYPGYSNMYEVDMATASPQIVTNQFPGQEIIPPYLINIAIMYLRPNSLDEQVPWIMSQLDSYNVVQLYVDVPELDTFFPHSVLVYDYEPVGNQVTLSVYDPNYSGKTRDIVLSKDAYGDYTIQGGKLVDDYGVTKLHAGEFYDISWPLLSGYIDELIQLVYDLVTSSCDDFLGFEAKSPINILITAPNRSRVGYDPSTHSDVNEIAGATYSGAESDLQTVLIPSPLRGHYTIDIFGTGTGNYTIEIKSRAPNGTVKSPFTLNGTTSHGKLDTYSIELKQDYTIVLVPWGLPLFMIAVPVAVVIMAILVAVIAYRRKHSTKLHTT